MSFITNLLYTFCINIGYYSIMIFSYLEMKYNNLFQPHIKPTYIPIHNSDDTTSLELEYQYKNRSYKITGKDYKKMKHYIEYTLHNLVSNTIPYYKWISAEVVDSPNNIEPDKLLSIIKTYSGPYGDFYAHYPELIQTPPSALNNTKIVLMDHKLINYIIDYSYKKDNYYNEFHNKNII